MPMSPIASPGTVMLDVAGTHLDGEDRDLLAHPATGGLILFSRNFEAPAQVAELIAAARQVNPELLVAVDQEGGRVQRFRAGLTRLPAMGRLAQLASASPEEALQAAYALGRLMAEELRELGVDISFAPVLDLDYGVSGVIGDRSFGRTATQVINLAGAWISGMNRAGMAATGKHFPGHGGIAADSHTELPVDERSLAALREADLQPFVALADRLAGIMPAHVLYPAVDDQPAGFSRFWLQQVLRDELGFRGVIFSDDLAMAGAASAGGYEARAEAALEAGCDRVLVCNDRRGAITTLEFLEQHGPGGEPVSSAIMRGGVLAPMTEPERRRAAGWARQLGGDHEMA